MRCKHCQWYDTRDAASPARGHCHGNGIVTVMDGGLWYSTWPSVNDDDYCPRYKEAGINHPYALENVMRELPRFKSE